MNSITIPINFVKAKNTPSEPNMIKSPQQSFKKNQLCFAAFADTHIGARYEYQKYQMADYLDKLGEDLTYQINQIDFAVHLGDIINHNTAQINGVGLPFYVDQYKNNLKKYFISHINIPLYCVLGNHDINDYQMNPENPHNLTISLIDELSMNSPVYAMLRDGILFLIIPELGYVQWTHPVVYTWIEQMVNQYPTTTTIIFCHQAIEDTTAADNQSPYCGKQDMAWWTSLFQQHPQIKMWIHGHNHMLSWYLNNQSSGKAYPIQNFGHDIAFSAPYSQLDWGFYHEEDRIVIYNITKNYIQTTTWEHNLFGGHWKPTYQYTWNIPTTYDPDAENWYRFSMFLQDNETQKTDMKLLSSNSTLELVGTPPMELFYDSRMESPSGRANEKILGFGNDQAENITWTQPGMQIYGPYSISFPEKYPHNGYHEDGRSGQPYHTFPMGTICSAIPGQTYIITISAQSTKGNGWIQLNMSCTDWSTHSQYSILPNSNQTVFFHQFGKEYETIQLPYTVPENTNAWFLQGILHFLNTTTYNISLFSIQRASTSNYTQDFHIQLSNHWYNTTGILKQHELVSIPINPKNLSNNEGIIILTAYINGNRFGMVNICYKEPLLLCRNARFRVNNYSNNSFNLSLTKTISKTPSTPKRFLENLFSNNYDTTNFFPSNIPKSSLFFIFLIIMIIYWKTSHQPYTAVFKLIPFSTHSLYNQIKVEADDHSEKKYISNTGNIWFSTSLPKKSECNLKILFPDS